MTRHIQKISRVFRSTSKQQGEGIMKKMKQTYLALLAAAALIAAGLSTGSADAAPILFDIDGKGTSYGPTADAADFIAVGVAGLTGSETVLSAQVNGVVNPISSGGVTISFDSNYQLTWNLTTGQLPTLNAGASEDLRRDYIFITTTQGSIGVSIGGTLGLSAKKIYTLHLIGNNGSFDQTSTFQPIDGSNITFASTAADSTGFLAVEFETGAGYVDGVDTLDFTWSIASPETGVFQGFAIVFVGPVVPRGTLISIR